MEIISSVLEETIDLIEIKKWRKCVPVDDFYELFHPYARSSKSISKLLSKAKHIYLIVVTMDEGLGNKVKEYFEEKEAFKGYILDRLGSFVVEEEIKKIDMEITRQCKDDGHATTHRYSPGYGDFSIKAQRTFFDLVKDTLPGLTISHGCLLSPEKTVTAIKGVVKPGC